jgi:hypothetical protein
MAIWGESFAPTHPRDLADPLIDDGETPYQSEPLGGLLALFGGLYLDEIRIVVARGMIAGYQSVLGDRFCYIPHDVIVPGGLAAGDLREVAGAFAPRALRLEGLVDGRNCLVSMPEIERWFESTLRAYGESKEQLLLIPGFRDDLADWLVGQLNR